jgi:hypothetical protein
MSRRIVAGAAMCAALSIPGTVAVTEAGSALLGGQPVGESLATGGMAQSASWIDIM